MTDERIELLRELTEAPGVSGAVRLVAAAVKKLDAKTVEGLTD